MPGPSRKRKAAVLRWIERKKKVENAEPDLIRSSAATENPDRNEIQQPEATIADDFSDCSDDYCTLENAPSVPPVPTTEEAYASESMELLERCSNCAELPICDIDELPLPDLSFDETLDLEDLSYASYRQSGDAVDVEELFTVSPALTQPVSLLSDLAQNEEFLLKSFSSDHRISPTLQLPLLANADDDEETQTEEKITTSKTIPNIAQFFVAGCFDKEEADSQAAASLPTESNARAIEADIATANTMQVDDLLRFSQSSVRRQLEKKQSSMRLEMKTQLKPRCEESTTNLKEYIFLLGNMTIVARS
ncbi:hypothetical protein RP20_CCG006816 [Aedes albopictus]|nr:hypothetical protein RP20_CCG006816 [Aedes albopictus]